MQDSHSCDPGSIPGRRNLIVFENFLFFLKKIFFIPAASRGQGGPVPPGGQGVPAEGGRGDGKVFAKSFSLINRKKYGGKIVSVNRFLWKKMVNFFKNKIFNKKKKEENKAR